MPSANQLLMNAARGGNLELFENALAQGANIRDIKEDNPFSFVVSPGTVGVEALHAVIQATEDKELSSDHIKIIERLLEFGVSVNRNVRPTDAGSYPLHAAARSGHEALVRLLLERGATLFTTGRECAALLSQAAYSGQTGLINEILKLLSQPPTDEAVAIGLESALFSAAQRGHVKIVEALLKFGVDANGREYSPFGPGNTPIMAAASGSHMEIVDLLRQHGADIWAIGDRGNTVLISAARGGLTELALELIAGGSNPNATNFYDSTPLDGAASCGNDVIAKALIERGADLRAKDNGKHTILHSAAYGGSTWIIEACLQAGEAIDVEDNWGYTPLMNAAKAGKVEAMQLLVSRGAQINHVAHYESETALHYAIYGKHLEASRWLVEHGANLEAVIEDSINGELTPLMQAVYLNQIDIVTMLLEAGASATTRAPESNSTALHHAALANATESAKMLLHFGSDVNAVSNEMRWTPLIEACLYGKFEIAKLLIENGANVNARDYIGETPLHKAAGGGRHEIVRLLLDSGADWKAVNNKGETAIDQADAAGYVNTVSILRSYHPS